MKGISVRNVVLVLASVLATVAVVYLTPLKHLNILDPLPHDVDPAQFWKEYSAHPDQYLFLDVREPDSYNTAHAKGAVNQPIGSLYDLRNVLPRSGKTIVLICSSGRLAGVAYGFLENQGFLNLLRIQGGTQQWAQEKLPLEGNNLLAPIPTQD
jgi:rhodanese-related sulfurtransferase